LARITASNPCDIQFIEYGYETPRMSLKMLLSKKAILQIEFSIYSKKSDFEG